MRWVSPHAQHAAGDLRPDRRWHLPPADLRAGPWPPRASRPGFICASLAMMMAISAQPVAIALAEQREAWHSPPLSRSPMMLQADDSDQKEPVATCPQYADACQQVARRRLIMPISPRYRTRLPAAPGILKTGARASARRSNSRSDRTPSPFITREVGGIEEAGGSGAAGRSGLHRSIAADGRSAMRAVSRASWAITPASSPSGPRSTSMRKIRSRVSWASAFSTTMD